MAVNTFLYLKAIKIEISDDDLLQCRLYESTFSVSDVEMEKFIAAHSPRVTVPDKKIALT